MMYFLSKQQQVFQQPQGQPRQQQVPTPPRQTQQSPVSQIPPQFNHQHQQAVYPTQVPFQQFPNMAPIPQANFPNPLQPQQRKKGWYFYKIEVALFSFKNVYCDPGPFASIDNNH